MQISSLRFGWVHLTLMRSAWKMTTFPTDLSVPPTSHTWRRVAPIFLVAKYAGGEAAAALLRLACQHLGDFRSVRCQDCKMWLGPRFLIGVVARRNASENWFRFYYLYAVSCTRVKEVPLVRRGCRALFFFVPRLPCSAEPRTILTVEDMKLLDRWNTKLLVDHSEMKLLDR